MRKIIIQFTLLVAICFPVEIWAETFNTSYESIIYECETTTKSARVVGGTNATGAIVIPNKISVNGNDYAVTAIGENTDNGGIYVFWGSDVTKITISEGIQEICVNALTCNTLEEVVLPQSLTTIGKYAFNGCTSLKTITIPDGVKTIEKNAFLGCTDLESASISKSVNNIGYGIFASCTKLSKITVATGNTVYDSRNECNAIIVSATNELLQGCIGTVIPSTVTRIGDSAFAGFPFTEFIIPDNIVSIGGHAFEACTSLESVTIPDGVTEIGNGAFLACISLAAIDIPSSVTSIGNNAFSYMPIVTLNIPSSVTTLGNSMVAYCENLESIRVNYINPIAISDQVFVAYDPQTWAQIGNIDATLYVPVGTKAKYEATEGWKEFKNIMEANAQSEPYAVLSNDGQTVTFYYDDQKAARGGIDINNSFSGSSPYGSAKTAVFDASFANYRPVSTAYWFQNCSSLTTITGIENLNTSNVTDMNSMFDRCYGLTSLDVSGFNTSNVTDMNSMFWGCSSLTSLDVSGFDTSSVTNMFGMFNYCPGLTSLDVSGFNTSKVTDMRQMFFGCSSLTSLDVSGFNTSNVTSMSNMFRSCSGLTSIDVSGFNTSNVTGMAYMFEGCSGLTSLGLSNFNTSNVTDMGYMFEGCSGLTSLDLNGFNTSKVTDMGYMFKGCSGLTSLDLSGFDTSNVKYMGYMFNGCSGLTSLDVSGFNTSNVPSMNYMFMGCSSLTSLDLSGFNTSNVTDMSQMFYGCSSLTSLDVSGFDTSNVTSMWSMFNGCSGLTSLDVSGFNTSNVTYMNCMFMGCSGLTSLDLSGFDTSKLTQMYYMFEGCSGLATIYADEEKWSTANVTNSNNMFRGCTSLVGGNGTVFDANHVDAEYARIDKPEQPGYFTVKEPELEPIYNADFSTEIDENTNLDGNVVGDILYSISSDDGSYDSVEGCIIVTKPTDDSAISGQDIFGADFQSGYTGIVFKINEGKGSIKVEAQTAGNMVLKVKIGNSDPVEMELGEKQEVMFPYDVNEETLVYIYGGMSSAGAKATSGTRASSDADLLKIYGFEVVSDASGIEAIENGKQTNDDAPVYNLNGQRVNKATKGIYIKNGKKVLVK